MNLSFLSLLSTTHMRHTWFLIFSRKPMVCEKLLLPTSADSLLFLSGHPPGVALFATNARYKREAYRGSEFAPRILADNGIQVVMKVRPRGSPS